MKKTKKEINQLVSIMGTPSFSPWIRSTFVVDSIQNYPPDTLYRLGNQLLNDYERLYIEVLTSFIENQYDVKLEKDVTKKELEEILSKISKISEDELVKLLITFQSTFNFIKRSLKISDFDQLEDFLNIIAMNRSPLENEKIKEEDLLDMLIQIPNLMVENLRKRRLLGSFVYKFIKNNDYELDEWDETKTTKSFYGNLVVTNESVYIKQ